MSNFPKGKHLMKITSILTHSTPPLFATSVHQKNLLDIHNTCLFLILAIENFNTYCIKNGSLLIFYYSWN
jgi:hypothetical protein